jgi:hypothetical protein
MIRKTYLIVLLFIFLFSSISLAARMECNDDGSIRITKLTKRGKVTAKQKGTKDPYIEVPGRWQSFEEGEKKYYMFVSKEAQFIVPKPTRFYVKIGKKSRRSVKCPAFKFSCEALNSTIDACYKRNNTFVAKFLINNIPLRNKKQAFRFGSPFTLKYALHVPGGRQITHSPTEYSPEFQYMAMTFKKLRKGNKYTLMTDGISEKIEKFSISKECKRSFFFDSKECTEMPSCRYDGDCMSEEFCKDEICEKLSCGDCEYAEKHECVRYDCCENSDCNNDEFCDEHICEKLDCRENEVAVDHSCDLLSCGSDEHTVDHECVKLECEDYEYAVNHTCELLICDYNEHIVDHKCEKLKCKLYQKAFDHDCLNLIEWVFAERGD